MVRCALQQQATNTKRRNSVECSTKLKPACCCKEHSISAVVHAHSHAVSQVMGKHWAEIDVWDLIALTSIAPATDSI